MFEYILFDLDGTITNSKEGITKSVQYALKAFGIDEPDLDKLEVFIGPPLKDSFREFYNFAESDLDKAVEKYRERFNDIGIFENELYPEIKDMLAKLHDAGKKLAIASSKPGVMVERILKHFEIEEYFDVVVGSELDGKRSRKEEVVEEALRQLVTKDQVGKNVAMVGDRKFDIEGAIEFGLTSVGVNYGFAPQGELEKAGAEYIVDTVDELYELLAGIHFPFLTEKGHIISLVGAGGKTSLMYKMARQCRDKGMKVLVSTTTHIMKPTDGYFVDKGIEAVRQTWENGRYATIGREVENGKISMLSEQELNKYIKEADIVFLEADGSKCLPLKVPGENEPVILEQSDIVIAVCGMSSLGKTFGEACFRLNETKNLLGKLPCEIIEKSDIVKILISENGSRKNVGMRDYYMVLNQCDDAQILQQAEEIIAEVKDKGFENIVAISINETERNI